MSILSFSNLSYSYDKKKNIFSNISAEMELGKIYAILGPSGCGKTTLLSLLGGLDSPTKGKILFNGEDITEKGFANHRRNHVLWSSIFVTLMANKIGGLQFGIYRNCQISSRVFHTAVAALPLTKANRSDFE